MIIFLLALIVFGLYLNLFWYENRVVKNLFKDPKYITEAYIELLRLRKKK